MMKTKAKSKTSKTNRKADESPSKPQAKKKGKTAPKKQSAKAKEEPADETAGLTETGSTVSLATTATTLTETSVAGDDAETRETATPPAVTAEGVPPATTEGAATNDSRMPAIGTVLQKRNRKGTLRCECEVVEGGVRYGGTVYRSLSSAAVAAAKDLGLAAKAMNGFTFWGVTRPARPATDPLGGLERAWNKYQARLEGVLERAKAGEHKEPALTLLERHARVLQNLHQEVAS